MFIKEIIYRDKEVVQVVKIPEMGNIKANGFKMLSMEKVKLNIILEQLMMDNGKMDFYLVKEFISMK